MLVEQWAAGMAHARDATWAVVIMRLGRVWLADAYMNVHFC